MGFAVRTADGLAVTEDGLSTNVSRGENAGRKLEHSSVTRLLEQAAQISADSSDRAIPRTLKLDPAWEKQHLHIVAFVQSQKDLKVVGAATARP